MFHDRIDAGRQLAKKLSHYAGKKDVVVLGLPRGGVPVAYEVAQALKAPLDVFLVRKLGVPGQGELAMGAIALGGVKILNHEIMEYTHVKDYQVQEVVERETEELNRRNKLYRQGHDPLLLKDKIVILIDDGVATGSTLKAAITALREEKVEKIIVAVPVAPPDTIRELSKLSDELICLDQPFTFFAISAYYEDFSQISSEEVIRLLNLNIREDFKK